jgi:hypothetical protein
MNLLSITDPLGRATKYTWCTCGGLSTLAIWKKSCPTGFHPPENGFA